LVLSILPLVIGLMLVIITIIKGLKSQPALIKKSKNIDSINKEEMSND
jgi:hypothetical protein